MKNENLQLTLLFFKLQIKGGNCGKRKITQNRPKSVPCLISQVASDHRTDDGLCPTLLLARIHD